MNVNDDSFLSISSIFERHVEHLETSLTAQEAIQLAVPSVLDEAIQVLATVPTEYIIVDQIPLKVHLFNPIDSSSTTQLHPIQTSIQAHSNQSNQYPISNSNSPILESTSLVPSYPFPTSSESNQSSHPSKQVNLNSPFHHQILTCTSDTASISDPSSPRSLSPTPSLLINRSMLTQLTDHEITTKIKTHPFPSLSKLSSNSLNQTSEFFPSSPTQPNSDQIHQRKTCLSFKSYVDILNSERALLDSQHSTRATFSSALNALRLARKSTSSLVKRASSIFSHPPPSRRISTNTNNIHINLRNDSIETSWVDRSRCTSNNSNYHSCPTHQPTIGENDQILPIPSLQTDDSEVLSDIDAR